MEPKGLPWRGAFRQCRPHGPSKAPSASKEVPKLQKYQKSDPKTSTYHEKWPQRAYVSVKKQSNHSPNPNPIPILIPILFQILIQSLILIPIPNPNPNPNPSPYPNPNSDPNQPDPPYQPDPYYTKRRTPILQFANPGPAECAKRLNNINII